jgi:hypothetical protein
MHLVKRYVFLITGKEFYALPVECIPVNVGALIRKVKQKPQLEAGM